MPSRFMGEQWGKEVADAVDHFPSATYRATKLEDYWQWIDGAKPNINGGLALCVRDWPDPDRGGSLLIQLDRGRVLGAQVADRRRAYEESKLVLAGDMASWEDMLGGYDVGKTVMYRRLMLEKGEVLEFFTSIYYWIELLVALASVGVDSPPQAT